MDKYASEHPSVVSADLQAALETYETKWKALPSDDPKKDIMKATLEVMQTAVADISQPAADIYAKCKDALGEWLDKQFGASLDDQAIFSTLARHYETEFFDDMEKIGVRFPDVVTRVSEYVPEVIAYVEQIIAAKFAYVAADGSVYFDTVAFEASGHPYCKLEPWSKGNATLLAEGEGALTGGAPTGKKHGNDFVLWKASKPGEPHWTSPWGEGRPGWHIECSAMATDILGERLDIHSGGIDLCFPHHDNEIAQVEAYYGHEQWVNYFLHAGHLSIKGLKMSKSLKNFITIQQALNSITPRQMRLLFLGYKWEEGMDFSDDALAVVYAREKSFHEFFLNVNSKLRQWPVAKHAQRWGAEEKELNLALQKAQQDVHVALCDSMHFPRVLSLLLDLITTTNKYLQAAGEESRPYFLLRKIAVYITRILACFGLCEEGGIGWTSSASQGGLNREETIKPVMDVFADFRDTVRNLARSLGKDAQPLLQACDSVRDDTLVPVGIRLEDLPGGKSVWKLDDPAVLLAERKRKEEEAAEKQAKKEALLREREEKERLKREKAAVPAEAMFKTHNPVNSKSYGSFDEQGIPLTDTAGEPLSKSERKKCEKAWAAQRKANGN